MRAGQFFAEGHGTEGEAFVSAASLVEHFGGVFERLGRAERSSQDAAKAVGRVCLVDVGLGVVCQTQPVAVRDDSEPSG